MEYVLEPWQVTLLATLAGERQRVIDGANQQIRAVDEARERMTRMFAWQAGIEAEKLRYEQRDGGVFVLVAADDGAA